MIAVVYANDGTITGYRNGRPTASYRSSGPAVFKAGRAQVVFGLRHGPPGGNQMLAGVVERAQLYDRALTAEEVAASASRRTDFLPEQAIVAEVADSDPRRAATPGRRIVRSAKQPADAGQAKVSYALRRDSPSRRDCWSAATFANRPMFSAPGGIASVVGVSSEFHLPADAPEAQRRLALASWLTSPKNPLFARVIVNRLWHHHFGVGLVDTPNDFGFNGGRPSHPQLLDWLAATLVEQNWSLKRLHREIVLSATYRQSFADNASRGETRRRQSLALATESPTAWRPKRFATPSWLSPANCEKRSADRDFATSRRSSAPAPTRTSRRRRSTLPSIAAAFIAPGPAGAVAACSTPSIAPIPPPPRRSGPSRRRLCRRWLSSTTRSCCEWRRVWHSGRSTRPRAASTARSPGLSVVIRPRSVARRAECGTQLGRAHGLAVLTRAIFNSNEFLYVD